MWCTMSTPVESVHVEAGERKIIGELSVQIAEEIKLNLNFDWCRRMGYICLYSGFFGETCNRVCEFPIWFHICRSPIRVVLPVIYSVPQFELYYQFPIRFHICRSPIRVVGSISYSVKDVSYSPVQTLSQIKWFIFFMIFSN
jgi:hypothetical protein